MQVMDDLKSLSIAFVLICCIAYYSLVSFESNAIESKSSKPYSRFGNPKKFFIDKIAGIILRILVPFHKCELFSHRNDDLDNQEKNRQSMFLKKIRDSAQRIEHSIFHRAACFLWNRLLQKKRNQQDFLVGGTVLIPRDPHILAKWGISGGDDSKQSASPDLEGEDGTYVEIDITCPVSVIQGHVKYHERKSLGLKKFKTCKLKDLKLSPGVPIVLYFHGGGFVLGSTRDVFPHLVHLVSKPSKHNGGAVQSIVLASVNYRLAPEHPFPAAVIDSLSSAKYIVENFPESDTHTLGFSAGGNLATVVGNECLRKYPGKIKSVVAVNPVTLPRSFTLSGHMNSRSSDFCPNSLTTWCMAAYLQLGDYHDEKSYKSELDKNYLYHLDGSGSHNPLLRLVQPQIDLPKEINADSAPKLFIISGSADLLRDDADDLFECLQKKGASVEKFEFYGSHGVAVLFDHQKCKEFIQSWGATVWS
jgi:acetyl esterase/lipase